MHACFSWTETICFYVLFGMPSLQSRSSLADDLGDPHRPDNRHFNSARGAEASKTARLPELMYLDGLTSLAVPNHLDSSTQRHFLYYDVGAEREFVNSRLILPKNELCDSIFQPTILYPYPQSPCKLLSHMHNPGSEFLSDAPFFGLSLCTEFQLANCACTSGWSCLMNLDLQESKFTFWPFQSCWPCSSKKNL